MASLLGNCPNCGAVITDQHQYSWCSKCGDPLPPELAIRVPHVQALREAARRAITPALGPHCTEAEKTYEGIGGWLILVAIALIRAPILFSVTLFRSVFPLLRHETWVALTTKDSEAYHPLWAPVIVSELVVNVIFLALAFLALILFFRRKRLFPKFMIGLMLANVIWGILLAFVYRKIPAMAEESLFDVETVGQIIACAIWIPYFLVSKRARATFTR